MTDKNEIDEKAKKIVRLVISNDQIQAKDETQTHEGILQESILELAGLSAKEIRYFLVMAGNAVSEALAEKYLSEDS